MSGILNSGKIATLLARLSAARATLLDNLSNLDTLLSTLLSDGGYSSARAAKLDNLDAAVSSIGSSPPTTSGLKGVVTSNATIERVSSTSAIEVNQIATESTASTSTFDVWTTILTETSAAGVIELMAVYQVANSSNRDAQLRFSIDGNVIYISDTDLWKLTGEDQDGTMLVGGMYWDGTDIDCLAYGSIPFTDSFLLEFKKTENAAGTVEIGTRARYHLT